MVDLRRTEESISASKSLLLFSPLSFVVLKLSIKMFAKIPYLFAPLLRNRASFAISQFSRSPLFISLVIYFINIGLLMERGNLSQMHGSHHCFLNTLLVV